MAVQATGRRPDPRTERPAAAGSLTPVTDADSRPTARPRRRPGAAGRAPRASAPASRWPSRRWPGWCGPSSRPSTATTRSCTTSGSCERFQDLGVVFVDDIAEVPPRPPGHAERPRLGARGGGRGPGPGRLRGRRRVPAGHQGAPRGQGAGRQGLPDRLRGPRGPRGGGRHDGGGPRGHPPGRERRRRRAPSPTSTEPVALLAQTTLSHRDWAGRARGHPRALPRDVDAGPQRPVLRHHQPPVGAHGDRARAATRWSSSARPTRPTPGRSRAWPATPAAPGCYRVNGAEELPDDLHGIDRRHRRGLGPRGAGRGRHRPPGAPRRRGRGGHHRRGRVLPAAAQPPRPARGPRHLRHLHRRAGRSPAAPPSTTAWSTPATCWPPSAEPGTRPLRRARPGNLCCAVDRAVGRSTCRQIRPSGPDDHGGSR